MRPRHRELREGLAAGSAHADPTRNPRGSRRVERASTDPVTASTIVEWPRRPRARTKEDRAERAPRRSHAPAPCPSHRALHESGVLSRSSKPRTRSMELRGAAHPAADARFASRIDRCERELCRAASPPPPRWHHSCDATSRRSSPLRHELKGGLRKSRRGACKRSLRMQRTSSTSGDQLSSFRSSRALVPTQPITHSHITHERGDPS